MKLPGRKNAAEPEQTDLTSEATDQDASSASAGVTLTKGRPTPKRRESAPTRGPVRAPKTRKEAMARQRQKEKENREARKADSSMTPAQRRAALRSGDVLAARDQGETKALARDWVDSRRMASNYLLLLFPLMIISFTLPQAQIVILLLFFVFVGEWVLTGRKVRALATERHGKAEGSNLSIGFYAGSRAYLPRRWRLPAPRVNHGDAI